MTALFDIPVTTLTTADKPGRERTMNAWAGHALLIVNTATECGYTPQFEGLQELFEEFQDRGFYVIGMPCNQFGGQEPRTEPQIAEFIAGYGVSFPMLARGDVNGENAHPLFQYLREQTGGADVAWNFEKFLVDPSGEVVARFLSDVEPDDDALIEKLEEILPI